jgi:hypothetical protein
MKTAMQELKDNSLFTEGDEYIQIVLKKSEWSELLEKEKEQIIKTARDVDSVNFWAEYEGFEEYYNKTYNQNK